MGPFRLGRIDMRPEYVWAVRVMDLDAARRARDLESAHQEAGEAIQAATRIMGEYPSTAAWIELVGGETRRVRA